MKINTHGSISGIDKGRQNGRTSAAAKIENARSALQRGTTALDPHPFAYRITQSSSILTPLTSNEVVSVLDGLLALIHELGFHHIGFRHPGRPRLRCPRPRDRTLETSPPPQEDRLNCPERAGPAAPRSGHFYSARLSAKLKCPVRRAPVRLLAMHRRPRELVITSAEEVDRLTVTEGFGTRDCRRTRRRVSPGW